MSNVSLAQSNGRRLQALLGSLCCAVIVAACGGGGGGGGEPVDQTPPTLSAQGATRAVVRKGDTAPLPASFIVTVSNTDNGTVTWRNQGGTSVGTGTSLSLSAAATALAAGEQTLTAIVTRPDNGRSAQATFSLLVLAENADSDDDQDGLSYSQEKAAGTEPGNVDTDGDGLADGAEGGLGTNPARADTDGNGVADGVQLAGAGGASLPARSLLAAEADMSAGIQIGADGLSVTFGDTINADCVAGRAPFDAPYYSSSAAGPEERCRKRAVRANVGVAPGEFRYFETRRLTTGPLPNIGQGIVTPQARIDPYCCFFDTVVDPDYATYVDGATQTARANNPTPSSVTLNSIGGVHIRLVSQSAPFAPGPDISMANTEYYGFAVDYRNGTDPLVYVVGVDSNGNMVVSRGVNAGDFASGSAAMPMLHGHPTNGPGPHAAINLGLRKFHYSLDDVRAAIDARGGTATGNMRGGVGIHRW